MRKMLALAFMAFFVHKAQSQGKTPEYFTIVTVGMNTGKDYSGGSEKNLYGKIQGVYGGNKLGLAYHALRVQPLGHKSGHPLEQYTIVSLGIGKIKHLSKESKVAFGGGPTIGIIPNHGSVPKTSSIFYGATAHMNFVNSVHIGGDLTFLMLPPKNSNDWAKNMLLGEVEILYFFNKTIGLKAIYGMEIMGNNERQVPGVNFQQSRQSDRRSNLIGGLCLKFGPAIFFVGPNIRTEGQKYSYNDQFGVYQYGKYSHNPPIGLNFSLNFIFESEDK
jgi:hypothetical protein